MQKFRTCFLILGVLLFCATAFGQSGSPTVYVSGGATPAQLAAPSAASPCVPPGPVGGDLPGNEQVCQPNVYVASTLSTPFPVAPTVFAKDSNLGQPQGMVLGPDNYLYVCEPYNGRIIRFNVASPATQTTVFTASGSGLLQPECGHFTSTGDLVVSDQASGSGVWEFQNTNTVAPLISVPLSLSSTPTQVLKSALLPSCGLLPFVGAGLTQLKNGDLAFVDNANGCLYISPYNSTYPHFSTARLISTGLTGAIGVARNSASDIFVSYLVPAVPDVSAASGQIVRLTSTFTSSTSDFGNSTEFTSLTSTGCYSSATDQPMDMAFSADDTLYVATQDLTGNPFNNPGKAYSITLASPGCSASSLVTTLPRWDSDSPGGDESNGLDSDDEYIQGYGIALPPTSVTNSPVAGTPSGTLLYNFGFSAFEAILTSSQSAAPCTGFTVTENQVFPANIDNSGQVSNLGPFPTGVTEAEPFYGEGGFNNVFTINYGQSCGSSTSLAANILIGAFSNSTNPRVIQCDFGTCQIDPSAGVFPLGALIPGDLISGGHAQPLSSFYLTNVPLGTSSSGVPTPVGNVCGPFFVRNLVLPDPTAVVDADDLLTITFRLTNIPATGPLCSGKGVEGISNAQVAATLAEISPAFNLITLPNKTNPGSPPLFTSLAPLFPGWYTYILNVNGLALGQSSLPETLNFTAIFNTNNASPQSVAIQVVPGK
ncbi:MAG: hypothetical protein WCD57_16360 [Acidobacteriaceae bacterium]